MRITFHGATRQVTGSAHLLEIGSHRILLDCGLHDHDRLDPNSLNREFLFDPRSLDAVILSHGHNDHIGRLPRLVRQGFRGTIFSTHAYTIRKDFVKVHLHVLPKTPSTWFYFPKIVSLPFYQFISQEALRMLKQTYTKEQEMSPFLRYLKSCNCTEITETRRCVSNFMPTVDRVKIVEALHVPELKAEVPTIYIDLTSN